MLSRLAGIPHLQVSRDVLLSQYTRFAIGGPADVLADAADEEALLAALEVVRAAGAPFTLIGGGTNLIVHDDGFRGVVLRFTGDAIGVQSQCVRAEAGASLQRLVDLTVEHGLGGLETMTGIPGWVGGAVYGNAGAYGHSIHERVLAVRLFDGREVRSLGNAECGFRYRESTFKKHKDWIIFSAELRLDPADAGPLRRSADEILAIRNQKYPPAMKCAGSIFKNLLLAELPAAVRAEVPERVVRDGKVPSAWFLEQAGAKGLASGDIRVADYHANLIYNAGRGTARQLSALIDGLKRRVEDRFGLTLEEEVQYVGFAGR